MHVLVVDGVLDIAVQVANVLIALEDGELAIDVLCPNELAPLLPSGEKRVEKC